MLKFLTIESLGVQCNPKCGNCRCGTCPIGGKSYSIKEERELKLIEEKLEFRGCNMSGVCAPEGKLTQNE